MAGEDCSSVLVLKICKIRLLGGQDRRVINLSTTIIFLFIDARTEGTGLTLETFKNIYP